MIRRRTSAFALAALTMAAAPAGAAVTDVDESSTFVHLFEWKWVDVAAECEGFLKDKGYAAVQISPPQESIAGGQWWTRYQPRSYHIGNRSGSHAQFLDMVARCNAAGVKIYADAVVNHMSAEHRADGFTAIDYPAVPYSGTLDFHNWNCSGIDYKNRAQVHNCSLVGLNDLKTESDYVRGKIADYLNRLTGWGVAGFRIDAAKHMPSADVAGVLARLSGSPYVYQEVLGAPDEAVQPSEYTSNADVYETGYQYWMTQYFRNQGASFAGLRTQIGSLLASDKAVVFTDTHDSSRDDSTNNDLSYKDGDLYTIANLFMLAYPYGYPKVMSSYKWSDKNAGPPMNGPNSGDSCFSGGWQCEHRYRNIANMVKFRKAAAGQPVTHWTDINGQAIAFGRNGKAFIVINKAGSSLATTLATGLPDGVYCDIANADYANGQCRDGAAAGPTITVAGGAATFNVRAVNASAIHVNAVVGGGGAVNITFQCNNGSTYWGQSVYVVGNTPQFGNWSPASALKLDPTSYPTWTKTFAVATSTTPIQWKCLKREEANPNAGVVWQPGANNSVTPNATKTTTASF